MMTMQAFTTWLLTQQHRDDPIGDLASEVATDHTWPADAPSLERLHGYLYRREACREAHDALDEAWRCWRRSLRDDLNADLLRGTRVPPTPPPVASEEETRP